jgi:transposase
MAIVRKQYTKEFKHEAVRLVTEQGLSIAQAARDLGLNDNVLARWKKELTQQGEQAFPGTGRTQEDELAKLRRENEILRREREILKKAVGIFSQQLP